MKNNLFTQCHLSKGTEQVEILKEDEQVRIEKISSSHYVSPEGFWYDQTQMEWVSILEGEAILDVEGSEIILKKGDNLTIPKHQRHRVVMTSEHCIWLCVFWKNNEL